MSFKRRLKYGNIMATRIAKRKVFTRDQMETIGTIAVITSILFTMKLALSAI
jgi:hypothetical protein